MADPTPSMQLIHRFHDGDRHALDSLLDRHLPWIEQHVRRRLGPALRHKLETVDLVQEAVIDFLEHGPRFEVTDDGALRGLLAQVIENNVRDAHKYHHRKKRDAGREQRCDAGTVLQLDPPADPSATPSQLVDKEERRAWIRLAIEFLDEDDRRVLLLREWEDRTFPEIGEELGITENNARMRYRRALPKLAEQVGRLRREGLPAATE